ncbi:Low molecular weight protein-tyrosine-phosphatase YfkJ [Hartmannibacter diazotrophicus]|uniref:protein-tyrosine-phosphatase n=1 Tax=Hartmannibacter diazotrophicus TaxID=1482074 RepID=A0A2C9DB08_9HYPH|nr:low molecular weight protein-tyrosine-phosphatase [Hartmannibacter diazotrophicus]SON57318.1 Low molecular weight protein-tyrosine-phosphatase YfkJ [Hartmannibacter diazotrophicus]
MSASPRSIIVVCLGNICRSPLGEGFLRMALDEVGLAETVEIDSAGTGGWHAGDPPDSRSIRAAGQLGIDISLQRARKVTPADFERFDLMLAMDRNNLADLQSLAPAESAASIRLFRELAFGHMQDVPDPYYGSAQDFAAVADLCREGAREIVRKLYGA